LAIVVSLVRKLVAQTQPSPRAPMAAPYITRAARSYTTPWDTIQVRDAIDRFVKIYNVDAAPFEWRKATVHNAKPTHSYAELRK